jgi:hypothetical protein
MRKLSILSVVSALLAASCVGAEKSSNPLSPSVAGPIPGVNITPPKPLEPRDGIRIAVEFQPVTLLLENAATNGERPLSYVFDVATDTGFTNKVFTREGVTPGEGGRTALRLPDPLASGRTYYWRAQARDGANTGPVSPLAFFTIFTPIVIEKPRLDSPINNVRIDDFQPEFRIGNAPRTGPVGAISYVLELSDTDSFANKVAVWTFREQPGQTQFRAPHTLVGDKQFFWRAQAFDTGASGPWSDAQVFRTAVPVAGPPGGGGGGAPGTPCGPPYPNQPFGIVQCRRSQYGHLSTDQILPFMRGVAKDLNAAGIAGGPYGILRKQSGFNCGGFSCDIICAGQGSSQRQYDVLIDAGGRSEATWGAPKTAPGIRVDICEIQ